MRIGTQPTLTSPSPPPSFSHVGPPPSDPQPLPVSVSIDSGPPTHLDVPTGWADYTDGLPSGAGEPGKTLTLTITSPTRRPADLQPDSSDERNLGVGVERVFSKLTLSQIRDSPRPLWERGLGRGVTSGRLGMRNRFTVQ